MRPTWNSLISTLVFAPVLALAGCADDPASPSDSSPDASTPPGDGIAGDITQSATWSGAVTLAGPAVIKPGVTVTVAAGAQLTAVDAAQLTVEGTLLVEGTADSKVGINAAGAAPWKGIIVESGGSASIEHATGSKVLTLLQCKTGAAQCILDSVEFDGIGRALGTEAAATIRNARLTGMLTNGSVLVGDGGDLTMTDSYISNASSDILITNAGSRTTVEYSEIGSTSTGEHCNVHVNGADAFSLTYSVLKDSTVAIMLGGTDGAVMNYNNIIGNSTDFQEIGPNSNADLQFNYWDQGAPDPGADYDLSGAVAAPHTAGPRQ